MGCIRGNNGHPQPLFPFETTCWLSVSASSGVASEDGDLAAAQDWSSKQWLADRVSLRAVPDGPGRLLLEEPCVGAADSAMCKLHLGPALRHRDKWRIRNGSVTGYRHLVVWRLGTIILTSRRSRTRTVWEEGQVCIVDPRKAYCF